MWPMWEAICDFALGWVPKAPKRESNWSTLVGRRGYESCVLINVQIHFEWCVGLEFVLYNILQSKFGSILDVLRLDVWIKALLLKKKLGGGFNNFLCFTPTNWGDDPIWQAYIFQIGWFNHHPESHQHWWICNNKAMEILPLRRSQPS